MKNTQTVNALRRLAYVIEEEWERQGSPDDYIYSNLPLSCEYPRHIFNTNIIGSSNMLSEGCCYVLDVLLTITERDRDAIHKIINVEALGGYIAIPGRYWGERILWLYTLAEALEDDCL